MSVHLLCVRHGLSTWNLQRRWQGQADPPLSDAGVAGAVELADALATTVAHGSAVSVWSSDLRRALSTAEIIAAHLHAGPVSVDRRLREADVGPWQGLTSPEIEEGWPGYISDGRRPDGFEAESALLGRVLPALVDIAHAVPPGALPIVVAHAGVLRAVRRHSGAVDDHLANLAGLWFAVDPGSRSVRFTGLFDRPGRAAAADGPER